MVMTTLVKTKHKISHRDVPDCDYFIDEDTTLEVIQREGCEGFGAGNFKSLFEAIEREQVRARCDRGARARAAHCRSPSRFSSTGSPPRPRPPARRMSAGT